MNDNLFAEQNSRTELLLGKEKLERLKNAHVLVVGLGGVGGYAVEQLCRAGIGEFTIVDADVVNLSNINRQLIALHSTIEKAKVDIIEERLLDINPQVKIHKVKEYIIEDVISNLLRSAKFDYIIEAIDTLAPKTWLIVEAVKLEIPIVSSMGAGGKLDPSKVSIVDISKTYNCGLARLLRKRLHKQGIFKGFNAVFSSEKTDKNSIIIEESRNKKTNTGTISYMPAIFGLFCASDVILNL